MIKPEELIQELEKIHPQRTIPFIILMALRSRIEFKKNIKNRICTNFKNGSKSVLLVGKTGSYKTSSMRSIFDGLNLDQLNSSGKVVGKWYSSSGPSTAIGIFEILSIYNDSIIFLDELNLDLPAHFHILKQVCNGQISRPKHDAIEPIDFTGTVISATNSIRIPKVNNLEHLLATLERFFVVKVKPFNLSPGDYLNNILNNQKENTNINWNLIKHRLVTEDVYDLNDYEKSLLRAIWNKKSEQFLDLARPQDRNCQTAKDIFIFTKRFFGLNDIRSSKKAVELAVEAINDVIIFNAINIMSLSPLEETIYNKINDGNECTLQEIIDCCDNQGMSVSIRYVHQVLNKLIQSRVIWRTKHGHYSTRRIKINSAVHKLNLQEDLLLASL